ncbi:MAG TPA: HAMP domain-containing sensor histidine kinase [Planctomycetota bacterium]|nr:HAMP domain-containing sensor histidine kinase [Planctomycetota bacterium]
MKRGGPGGRKLWILFAIGVAAVLAVMTTITRKMIDLERGETEAKHAAAYQRKLRIALWRLDHAFSEMLRREAERPPEAYATPIEKPDFIRLHFQVDADGNFTSPQVYDRLPADTLARNCSTLDRIEGLVGEGDVLGRLKQAEEQTASIQQLKEDDAWQQRAQVAAYAKKVREDTTVGSLEPLWEGRDLVFVRRAGKGLQGFLVDWPRLEAELLGEIEDLFPDARLVPAADDEVHDRLLFTLPVMLDAAAPGAPSFRRWTATHTALLVTWAVVLLAVAGFGFALKKSVDFGTRQRRFASLVTHELRSPLTTFRLYSDLLAQGLVKEEKRAIYHDTLRQESGRMARMVENVIAHARLEEGRAGLSRREVTLAGLIEEAAPALRRCAEGAGLALSIGEAPLASLVTDPAAVGQILFNLVENACKYGRSAIEVAAEAVGGVARIAVLDHGPGVPGAARLFRPFERAGRDEADPVRGLGLGLALSRGLARDLGGDLTHEAPAGGGARFVLTLPVA